MTQTICKSGYYKYYFRLIFSAYPCKLLVYAVSLYTVYHIYIYITCRFMSLGPDGPNIGYKLHYTPLLFKLLKLITKHEFAVLLPIRR